MYTSRLFLNAKPSYFAIATRDKVLDKVLVAKGKAGRGFQVFLKIGRFLLASESCIK